MEGTHHFALKAFQTSEAFPSKKHEIQVIVAYERSMISLENCRPKASI